MATGAQKTTQTMQVTFDSGMDQRTHPRQTQAGAQVLEAVNVRYNKIGGVEKRPGISNLTNFFANTSRAFSAGVQGKLIANENELIVTDGYHIGSRSIAAGTGLAQFLIERGLAPEAVSKLRPISSSQYQLFGQDICYSPDGLIFHAWLMGANPMFGPSALNDVYTTVEDASTGSMIVSSESEAGTGTWWPPKLVACGTSVYLMWCDNTQGTAPFNLYYKKWDRVNMVWGSRTTLRSDLQGDFAVCASNTFIYLICSASGTVNATKYNTSLASVATTNLEVVSAPNSVNVGLAISARHDDAITWAAYCRHNTSTGSNAVRAVALDASLSMAFAAPFTTYTGTSAGGIQLVGVAVDENTNNGIFSISSFANSKPLSVFPVYDINANVIGNASAPNRSAYWVVAASKPFVRGLGSSISPKRAYVFALVGGAIANTANATTPAQYTHMLLELGIDTSPITWSPRPITWQAPRFAAVPQSFSSVLPLWGVPSTANLGNGFMVCDAIIRRNNRQRVSLSSHVIDFNPQNRFLNARLGQTVFMSPGFYWDKSRLAEVSFSYWPQALDSTVSLTGGALANGTYLYRALYEFVDANGFVHQSIPSDAMSVVVAGGTGIASVTLTIPALTVTARQNAGNSFTSVRIVLYRQVSSGPLSGTYLRLFSEGLEPTNDTTQQYITVLDNGTTLIATTATEELYTDSGVFPNVMPSGFTACVTYRNRIWVAYGHTVNYSKSFVTGSTVNFTDAFELPLEESGDITAMWVMDDTLYISTENRLYFLQANGPNDFGQQNDVDTPNRVATDFGCIEPRSVVVTQVGTLYQSRAGIQLMDRKRQVAAEQAGSRVQTDLANFPIITGTNIHPDGRTCAFDCGNTAGTLGVRLVYDYATDRWSRDTILSAGDQSGSYIISETVANGMQFMLVSNGVNVSSRVFYENPAIGLDDGGWVTMSISIGEVHPLGLQGNVSFVKWTVQQERLDAYGVLASFFKDYEASPYMTAAFTDAQIVAMSAPQFSFDTSIHRAQSMRIKLSDSAPITPGTGFAARWIGLAVELDPRDNQTFKLPATNKS